MVGVVSGGPGDPLSKSDHCCRWTLLCGTKGARRGCERDIRNELHRGGRSKPSRPGSKVNWPKCSGDPTGGKRGGRGGPHKPDTEWGTEANQIGQLERCLLGCRARTFGSDEDAELECLTHSGPRTRKTHKQFLRFFFPSSMDR